MSMKIAPEHEAYVAKARAAREEQAERLAEHPPRRFDYGVFRAKRDKRRAHIEGSAARGDLRRWGVNTVAECFSDEELPRLLELDEEGREEKRRVAERRREGKDVAALARKIEREREQAAREDAKAEAARRLGVEA